jgi:hypothetical protein
MQFSSPAGVDFGGDAFALALFGAISVEHEPDLSRWQSRRDGRGFGFRQRPRRWRIGQLPKDVPQPAHAASVTSKRRNVVGNFRLERSIAGRRLPASAQFAPAFDEVLDLRAARSGVRSANDIACASFFTAVERARKRSASEYVTPSAAEHRGVRPNPDALPRPCRRLTRTAAAAGTWPTVATMPIPGVYVCGF